MLRKTCRDFSEGDHFGLLFRSHFLKSSALTYISLIFRYPNLKAELKPNAGKYDKEHLYPAESVKKMGELGLMVRNIIAFELRDFGPN